MSSHVSCTVTDGIAHVQLRRADKLNALTLDILDDLVATATRLRKDKTLRAVIISGDGDAFCAGLDFARPERLGGALAQICLHSIRHGRHRPYRNDRDRPRRHPHPGLYAGGHRGEGRQGQPTR